MKAFKTNAQITNNLSSSFTFRSVIFYLLLIQIHDTSEALVIDQKVSSSLLSHSSLENEAIPPLEDLINLQIDQSIQSNVHLTQQSDQELQQGSAHKSELTALKRNLKKLLAIREKNLAKDKGNKKPASLDQIHISPEVLENLSMDDVVKIAQKTSKGSKSKLKPMDKVVLFLQQEQKLMEEEKKKKKQEVLEEVIREQNEAEQAEKEKKETEKKAKQEKRTQNSVKSGGKGKKFSKPDLELLQINQNSALMTKEASYEESLKDQISKQQAQLLQTKKMLEEATNSSTTPQVAQQQSAVNLAALEHLKADLKTEISQKNNLQKPTGAPAAIPQWNNSNTHQEGLDKPQLPTAYLNPEDNMSLSEIILQKYKKQIKINEVKSPEQAAQILIKDTKQFDVNDQVMTEGSSEEQKEYMKQLGDIETNESTQWKDLSQVKQRLWTKLHKPKELVKVDTKKSELLKMKLKAAQKGHKDDGQKLSQVIKNKKVTKAKSGSLAQTSLQSHKSAEQHILTESKDPKQMETFSLENAIYQLDAIGRSMKLYEIDTGMLVALIVISAVLLCCCVLMVCICCFISSAGEKAQKEQEKAYQDLVEEVKKEKAEEKNEEKE